MPMSIEGRPDEERSIHTVHAALDAGITLIDTADAYHLKAGEVGHNEALIAKALASYGADTSDVLVATKGGHLRPGDGSWTVNGSPEYVKRAAEESLKRLGGDAIGLYSSTARTRPSPTPNRSARSATCSTPARSAWPVSRTRTPTRSCKPRRSW